MGKFSNAIPVLIAVNIVMFLITFWIPGTENKMFETMALYFPQNEHFRYWHLVTNMFMHGNFGHILFNMYGLWAFGTPLEDMWGRNKFLVFYFLTGIGAAVIYTLVNYYQFNTVFTELIQLGISSEEIKNLLTSYNPEAHTLVYDKAIFSAVPEQRLVNLAELYHTPAVGASGAIYGVLVAFGMSYPNAKLALIFFPVPIAAKYFIPLLIGLDLFSGVTGVSLFGGGIAHFAHIGGAIIGFLLMWLWRKNKAAPGYVS